MVRCNTQRAYRRCSRIKFKKIKYKNKENNNNKRKEKNLIKLPRG
ncbi:hypothetical protein DOY81_011157 [Sarcophaga bullata]|nr:hypothetical protein DOY81_011157 [Sarcophaga bullata]